MLKLDSNVLKPNYQTYHSLIFKYPRVLINRERLDSIFYKDDAIVEGLLKRLLRHMNSVSGENYTEMTPDILVEYLTTHENVPLSMLTYYDWKTKKDKVITTLDRIKYIQDKGYAQEFFNLYVPYRELYYSRNGMKKNKERMLETKKISHHGNPMVELPFYYTHAVTGRTYAKSTGAQNIGKQYLEAIESCQGYYLLWCDFKQIDMRVAMELCLRSEHTRELDEYMDLYPEDSYKAVAAYVFHANGVPFDEELFMEKRDPFKTAALACIYQSSVDKLTSVVKDEKFAKFLHTAINTNPRYIDYMQSLKDNMSIPENFTVNCYFGSERYCLGGMGDLNERSIYNTPIQGTSQEIMEFFTREVCRRMKSVSTNDNQFFPMLNRHDEMIFLVHKDLLQHMHLVIDCMRIQVDDWKPLGLEWGIGKRYGVEDEEAMAIVNEGIKRNPPKVVNKSQRINTFYPSERSLVLDLVHYYYGKSSFKGVVKRADTIDKSEIIFSTPGVYTDPALINKLILEHYKDLIGRDYDRVIIYSDVDSYRCIGGVDVFEIHDETNATFQHHSTMVKRLCNRYIQNELRAEVPDDLKNYEYVPMHKELKKTWWI